jgi:hypothetical protein
MVLYLKLEVILGMKTPVIKEKIGVSSLLTSVGAFSSSPTATMSISSPSTSSMPIQREPHQMILPAVYNSALSYGIRMRQASTNIILHITDSQRRRATGVLHDLWSYGSYTHRRGMIQDATCWETITLPILQHM